MRDRVARGQEIDGTFEFHYLKGTTQDYCEYDYILVIDIGWSEEREASKNDVARAIGKRLAPVLKSDSFAVRLRLQNAAFVHYTP